MRSKVARGLNFLCFLVHGYVEAQKYEEIHALKQFSLFSVI
jgi:hypothetical protein